MIVPIWAAQPTTATSVGQISSAWRPDGNWIRAVSHVVRSAARDALLEEGVAAALLARREDDARVHALRPALERRRPPRERAHDAVPDGEVVLDDVELGDRARALGRREDHAIGAGHAQIAPTGVDDRGLGRGHAPEFYRGDAPRGHAE